MGFVKLSEELKWDKKPFHMSIDTISSNHPPCFFQ
jgi:hypothetical protein